MMGWVVAAVLGMILAWQAGVRFSAGRAFCAYCHAPLGLPPENLDHWRECPIHPARFQVEALHEQITRLERGQ